MVLRRLLVGAQRRVDGAFIESVVGAPGDRAICRCVLRELINFIYRLLYL